MIKFLSRLLGFSKPEVIKHDFPYEMLAAHKIKPSEKFARESRLRVKANMAAVLSQNSSSIPEGLTPNQYAVYLFIKNYIATFGGAPLKTQIAIAFKWKSVNTSRYYLDILQEKGFLIYEKGKFGGIEIVK